MNEKRALIISIELVFIVTFAGWTVVRAANPEILGTEKAFNAGGKIFALVVDTRDKSTLHYYCKKFIAPGSAIISDGWKGYLGLDQLKDEHFEHFVVNHSDKESPFVNPETGHCTNTVEGKWHGLKSAIPRQGFRTKEMLNQYLWLEMWKNLNKGREWAELVNALINIKYK